MMNKKGFAISTILYALSIIFIAVMFLLLGLLQFQYKIGSNLRENIEEELSFTLAEQIEKKYGIDHYIIEELGNKACTDKLVNSTNYKKIKNNVDITERNYIKYHGYLWRIVSLNCDGTVKIISQDKVGTSMEFDIENDYENSNVYRYLNTTFLSELSNSIDFIRNSTEWYYNVDHFVSAPVGLLTYNEFTSGGSYIKNGYNDNWYILNSSSSSLSVKVVKYTSDTIDYELGEYNVRPSVVLLPNLVIKSGNGTSTNPFTLKNDIDS